MLPPKFSWMTFGHVALTSQQRARDQFGGGRADGRRRVHATVFRLEPGQVGVAFNAPQTVVYVVRPSEFTPSYEVRWRLFLHDDFGTYVPVGMQDQMPSFQAWLEEIKKSAGFEWGPGHKAEQASERDQGRTGSSRRTRKTRRACSTTKCWSNC